jgi:hypothetical protein
MKLGLVPEGDRLLDSPDVLIVVEPDVGSVARTKGSLYLLVTGRVPGSRVADAARQVAETIRTEYYYDESAGIRVCIRKAVQLANKKLGHQRDRLGVGPGSPGPIGVALAVVRGSELYVATAGPAEAYLVRQARLLTLPDPNRDRGLPADELEPEIWRGEIVVGDSLVLVSANVVARLGPDELKDAMVTLHPQSAVEHLHHRFVASDGTGSDGAIAIEAAEVPATAKQRALVPVRPPEPHAGTPNRSPIPLADDVSGGVAAVQAGAGRAGQAARGAAGRALGRLQDRMPRRAPRRGRVNPVSSRRAAQRRVAVALLAFLAVASGLGLGVYFLGRPGAAQVIDSVTAAQRAFQAAEADVAAVFAPGIDLVRDDRAKATKLLADAYQKLADARAAGVPESNVAPLRTQVIAGLDRIYHVVNVSAKLLFSFDRAVPNVEVVALVQGPDGVPYVLDRTTETVYRVDLKARKATQVLRAGQLVGTLKVAAPKMLAMGGPDLLVLDAKNVLWRWRPADSHGAGTLTRVRVTGASSWGPDILAIGTFVRNADKGLYNLYVLDPSERQVLRYAPAADGTGYPAAPTGFLATAQAVDDVDAMFIDGDVFLAEGGIIGRYVGGQTGSWRAVDPGDTILRPAPRYVDVSSADPRNEGVLYAFDEANSRLIALDKPTGAFREQYRIITDPGWRQLRAMYVVAGTDGDPATLIWTDGRRLYSSVLQPAATSAGPSASATPGASGAAATAAGSAAAATPSGPPASP